MLIKEQMRKYKVKMEEISQLEAAESIASRRLSFLRQNSVSTGQGQGLCPQGRTFRGHFQSGRGLRNAALIGQEPPGRGLEIGCSDRVMTYRGVSRAGGAYLAALVGPDLPGGVSRGGEASISVLIGLGPPGGVSKWGGASLAALIGLRPQSARLDGGLEGLV